MVCTSIRFLTTDHSIRLWWHLAIFISNWAQLDSATCFVCVWTELRGHTHVTGLIPQPNIWESDTWVWFMSICWALESRLLKCSGSYGSFSSASATMCFLGAGWLYDISESRILVSQIVSNYMYVKILQNLPKIWCPGLGLPAHEGPEGPQRWPKSWSTSLMEKGWGSWACLAWRSEGSRESSLRPSRRELSCRRKTVFLCSLIVIGQGGVALN